MKSIFEGVAPAIVTPFKNGKVDFDGMRKIINNLIKGGVAGIIVLGTTGESSTLSDVEKEEIVTFAKTEIAGRVKMIVGTGANDTAKTIKQSVRARELGADGLLVVTPYYNKCTQKGCIAHYKAICDAAKLPIIVYNVPGRTGFNLLPETMAALAELEWVYGIKEANGDIAHNLKVLHLCNGKIAFYTGNDDLSFTTYANGGQGSISVTANVYPDICANVFNLVKEGKFVEARQLNQTLFQANQDMFIEVNPIPVKAALMHYGFCTDEVRMPLSTIEDENREKLIRTLKAVR